jgi:hypothetical protein
MATWRVICPNGHMSMWRDGASVSLIGCIVRCPVGLGECDAGEFRVTPHNAIEHTCTAPDDVNPAFGTVREECPHCGAAIDA